jgi:hypothetical protein
MSSMGTLFVGRRGRATLARGELQLLLRTDQQSSTHERASIMFLTGVNSFGEPRVRPASDLAVPALAADEDATDSPAAATRGDA